MSSPTLNSVVLVPRMHPTDMSGCVMVPSAQVVYGATDKNAIAVNASQLLFNNVSVHGFWLSEWYNNADEQRRQALYAQVADEIRDGMVLPAHSFPLEALHEALRAAMSPRQGRKVLFSCR